MDQKRFLEKIIKLASGESSTKANRLLGRSEAFTMEKILDFVAIAHQVESKEYVEFRCAAPEREMAAFLCRQLTSRTLFELSVDPGLKHPGSSANLDSSASYRKKFNTLKENLI